MVADFMSMQSKDPAETGAAPPEGGEPSSTTSASASGSQPEAPRPPVRHNLPVKTAPVVGRKLEMEAIARAFEKARSNGQPGRVEVVGRLGVGATTVAVELARRAGARMAGGAWYLDAS